MKTSTLFLAIFFFAGAFEVKARDFTPHEERTFVDGPAPRHYSITDGSQKIHFRIDLMTTVSGSPQALDIRFTDVPQAGLRIYQSPIDGKKTPIAANEALYLESAQKLLPAGSTEIELTSQKDNVFPINDWSSRQYNFQYNNFGRALVTSLTFLNYTPDEQWVVEVTSTGADAGNIASRVSRLMNSLHGTDASVKMEDIPN